MKPEPKPYQPISCSFYDLLEEAATLKKPVELIYGQDGNPRTVMGIIVELFIRQKVEWLRFDYGQEIRLDHIISLNGEALASYC